MNDKKHKRLTFLDLSITAVSFGVIFFMIFNLFFVRKDANRFILVETKNSKYLYALYQKKDVEISGENGLTHIIIDDGKFRFIESACPNKDCVKTGWISLPYYPVVCLPNKVSAYIINEKEEDQYDGISR